MSNEYELNRDASTIGGLLHQLSQVIAGPASYEVSNGYRGRAVDDSYASRGPYQGRGYASGQNMGIDPVRVNAIIEELEKPAWRIHRCLEDRLSNAADIRRDGKVSTQAAAAQHRSGEQAAAEEAGKCRELLAKVSSAIQAARQALARAESSWQTNRRGLVGVVSPTATQGRVGRSDYATLDLLDQTLYRLSQCRQPTPSSDRRPEPVPYLASRPNDRHGTIDEKVVLGDGLVARDSPPTYVLAKPYWISPDPNNPLERANYDRYRGRIYY